MTQPADDDAAAALYALGSTDGDERERARKRLAHDPKFAANVASWDLRLAALAPEDDVAPPPALWERISAAVDRIERSPACITIRADEAAWEAIEPGISKKLLNIDVAGGWESFLLRLDPGAVVKPHGHPILEECLVLDGLIEIDGTPIRQGDLHLAFPGTAHASISSASGALLYIRGAIDA